MLGRIQYRAHIRRYRRLIPLLAKNRSGIVTAAIFRRTAGYGRDGGFVVSVRVMDGNGLVVITIVADHGLGKDIEGAAE